MAISLTIPVSRPPRTVPLSTKLVVLFGGTFSGFGWLFFGFGMVFVWIFAGKGDYTSAFIMRGNLESAPAVVTGVRNTRFSEGGSKHSRGTPIYAYHYKFQREGIDYQGTSYRLGQGNGREGDETTVEFPAGKPRYSRIKGMRRAMFGPVVAMVLLFPAVGLTLVVPSVFQGWRNLRLLKDGETAQGTLITKEPTNVKVNNRTVYKLTFEFSDQSGQTRQAIAKTYLPEKLEANRSELLFYDPNNPSAATLLDNLPGKQALTERGEIQPCGFGAGLRAVLLPFAAMAVVVGGVVVKLL
jgi:hypothetical protein